MHAFILYGGTSASRKAYISELKKSQVEFINIQAEKASIGIKQIQAIVPKLSLDARLPRILWIEDANLLTISSQNALLKLLEEPPFNTTIYLSCDSHLTLLPTIRSRCSLINSPNSAKSPNSDNSLSELKRVMSLSPGDRLMTITKRDRAESIDWIITIEHALKEKLHSSKLNSSGYQTLAKIAKIAQNAHSAFASNCSVSLTTQNFYLLLPHTRSAK